MRSTPSLGAFVKSDYFLMLGFLGPAVTWVLALIALLFPQAFKFFDLASERPEIFLGLALLVTIVALPLALRRLKFLQRLFREGLEVEGVITSLWMEGDRGRVEFRYDLEGRSFESGQALHRNPKTQALEEGQTIPLLVDPQNPERAILPSIF